MKSPLKNLCAELVKETAIARENLAATSLKPQTIRTEIHHAARAGQSSMRIRLPDGLDVRGTENAQHFMSWAEDSGLRVTWERRACNMPDGRVVDIVEPEISWEPKSRKS